MNRLDVLRQLAHPIVLTYILSVLMVSLIAAMTALVLIGTVIPIPSLPDPMGVWERNVAWSVIGGSIVAISAPLLHLRLSWTNLEWLARGGLPRPHEARAALRQTTRQVVVEAFTWGIAVLGFVLINMSIGSTQLLILITITLSMSGAVSTALNYVLGERILRPLTAIAMSVETPEQIHAPGVGARVLLIWGLTTAVPTFGIVLVSLSQIVDQEGPVNPGLNLAVLVQVAIAMAIGMIGIVAVSRSISDPLRQVSNGMSRVEAGDLAIRVNVYDGSEIGELQTGFNRMVLGLSERRRLSELFVKHVGEEIARSAIEQGNNRSGSLVTVTALVIDLVGSTTMATTHSPEEVVGALNEFFEHVVDEVTEHDGFVTKFEGDAAIAVFGAPIALSDPEHEALACALALHQSLRGRIALDFGIGVATGTALAGNIGATNRFEYTILGGPVIAASALSDLAKKRPGRVVASAVTLLAAPRQAPNWSFVTIGDERVAEPVAAEEVPG